MDPYASASRAFRERLMYAALNYSSETMPTQNDPSASMTRSAVRSGTGGFLIAKYAEGALGLPRLGTVSEAARTLKLAPRRYI